MRFSLLSGIWVRNISVATRIGTRIATATKGFRNMASNILIGIFLTGVQIYGYITA